jgi:hypothetical protein
MADSRDIILNEDNEIQFFSGDFLIGDSDSQHIQHIIEATKGNFLENPTVGVNITEYKNGNVTHDEISKRIRVELQKDGYYLNAIQVNQDEIKLDAQRIR